MATNVLRRILKITDEWKTFLIFPQHSGRVSAPLCPSPVPLLTLRSQGKKPQRGSLASVVSCFLPHSHSGHMLFSKLLHTIHSRLDYNPKP